MDEMKIAIVGGLGLVALLLLPLTVANVYTKSAVVQLVEAGNSPIEARCAVTKDSDELCLVFVSKMEGK